LFRYSETIDNSINLFLDVTTVCNLNCHYCFARKEKEWERLQDLDRIKYILKTTLMSSYKFNLILFGGEALAHPQIEEIVKVCNSQKNILNTIILTNGCIDGKYNLEAEYVFTLHDISDEEYEKFKENLKIPSKVIINVVLKKNKKFKDRYIELDNLEYKIEHSQIYGDDVIVKEDLSGLEDFNFLNLEDTKYVYKGKKYNYSEYFKIHQKIIPKNIGDCLVQELNIDIDGVISNDCNNTLDNIFKNPLFFKNYNNRFNCQRERCTDCTGTIRTTKLEKEI